jgi:hypothetical protein
LHVGQFRQLTARESEKFLHLLVDIRPIRRGRRFPSGQQLGNVRVRDFGGRRQVLLLEAQLRQSLLDDETNIHGMPSLVFSKLTKNGESFKILLDFD